MTATVIDQKNGRLREAIGVVSRVGTRGPESALVDAYITHRPEQDRRYLRTTVFREPRIATGFPDLVIAHWRPTAFRGWREERAALRETDIRVLHFLYGVDGADIETLCRMVDPMADRLAHSLERLSLARLVRFQCGKWTPRRLHAVFGIKELIAIEAKVHDWRAALEQARANQWFASRSYVLLPQSVVSDRVRDQAGAYGVGVIARSEEGNTMESLSAARNAIPLSYASWLFNEWVGRSIAHLDEGGEAEWISPSGRSGTRSTA